MSNSYAVLTNHKLYVVVLLDAIFDFDFFVNVSIKKATVFDPENYVRH